MPIYEFYCPDCHTVFNFLSRSINTTRKPDCPKCDRAGLERQVSLFASIGKAKEEGDLDDLPIDESKMESAITELAGQADSLNEDDPRQAAQLMRKFSNMTGLEFGRGMQEALGRMEAGEDPERIESEMGDLLDNEEEPFVMPEQGGSQAPRKGRPRGEPRRDPGLYEL